MAVNSKRLEVGKEPENDHWNHEVQNRIGERRAQKVGYDGSEH